MSMKALKGEEIMTNEQYYGLLRMILKIILKCKDKEEAVNEVRDLLRDEPDRP